jgi:hypothetical protein
LRVHMRLAEDTSASAAWSVLEAIHQMPDRVFWNDGFSYREVPHAGLVGLTQVTDAWLADLARRHEAKLATLDTSLVAIHPEGRFSDSNLTIQEINRHPASSNDALPIHRVACSSSAWDRS